MPADRVLIAPEAQAIVSMARAFAQEKLAPRAAAEEAAARFPRADIGALGELGLLAMPYPEALGGGDLSYEVYLQVVEELAAAWATVAVSVSVSVHVMACYPLHAFGSDQQRERWLPGMLAGDQLGGYCLSEAHAGSDPGAIQTHADEAADGGFCVSGTKAWVTHGGHADFYALFARTSPGPRRGISCLLVPASSPGLTARSPEAKMGLTGSPTLSLDFDEVGVDRDRLIGSAGQGLEIALKALDSGRLGIAAVAVGVAQSALDHAVAYARERSTFGQRIIDHQGLGFLLADMAAAVESARAVTLDAARRRDRDLPFARQASVAKLVATDAAMRVTTDAVQVLGGAGYTRDFPVERLMREAKVMQIFEGTNQIQRMVIARHLAGPA